MSRGDRRSRRRGIAFVDVDDTIREVHGYAKQGATYGYSGVRGLNLQLSDGKGRVLPPPVARTNMLVMPVRVSPD